MSGRVLVVDDDPAQRTAFGRVLEQAGYTVDLAADASEALRKSLQTLPDVVVLSLVRPGANGVELAGALRAVMPTRRTPIVIVTAYTDAAVRLDSDRFGAECVLTKPVSDQRLHQAVARCLAPAYDEDGTDL